MVKPYTNTISLTSLNVMRDIRKRGRKPKVQLNSITSHKAQKKKIHTDTFVFKLKISHDDYNTLLNNSKKDIQLDGVCPPTTPEWAQYSIGYDTDKIEPVVGIGLNILGADQFQVEAFPVESIQQIQKEQQNTQNITHSCASCVCGDKSIIPPDFMIYESALQDTTSRTIGFGDISIEHNTMYYKKLPEKYRIYSNLINTAIDTAIDAFNHMNLDISNPNIISQEHKDLSSNIKNRIFKLNLYNNSLYPDNTHIACWYCTESFSTPPIGVPIKKDKEGKYYMYGNFCSLECCASYVKDQYKDSQTFYSIYELLMDFKKTLYNLPAYEKVEYAPPRIILDKFGGCYNIQTYRNITKNHKNISIHSPPMIPTMMYFEELNDDNQEMIQQQSLDDVSRQKGHNSKTKQGIMQFITTKER